MKVLHVATHLNPGGISTYIYNISKYLVRNGIEVAVASSGGTWESELHNIGVKTFIINIKTKSELSPKVIFSLFGLKKIKKDFSFDILQPHTRVTQILCALYAKIYKTPYISNFHGFYEQNKMRLGRRLVKAHGKRAIAITPQTGDDLTQYFGADPKKVKVILSAIDFERLDNASLPLNLTGNPTIGASGRLSPVKGFDYLIASMPQIINDFPQAQLYLYGQGNEEKSLLHLADKLKISDKVNIVKNVPIADFLKALDIFCLPSIEEPLGLSVIEAQYFGIPSIVSNAGGLTTLVENEKTGLIVEKADSSAIAAAVKKIMLDDELKKRISINCQKQAREKFDLSKKINDFIAVYHEALT
jgi:glycosyltransferase involved in cell wall biosynthesis